MNYQEHHATAERLLSGRRNMDGKSMDVAEAQVHALLALAAALSPADVNWIPTDVILKPPEDAT